MMQILALSILVDTHFYRSCPPLVFGDAQGERADGAGGGAPPHGARAQQDRRGAGQDQPSLERRDHLSCEYFFIDFSSLFLCDDGNYDYCNWVGTRNLVKGRIFGEYEVMDLANEVRCDLG